MEYNILKDKPNIARKSSGYYKHTNVYHKQHSLNSWKINIITSIFLSNIHKQYNTYIDCSR